MRRRTFLFSALAGGVVQVRAAPVRYPEVEAGRALVFPRDHGAHPDHRIEWWYITGWLRSSGAGSLGFQITFFRARPGREDANPSRFAPRQILFAHAALADPARGRLLHAERSARAALGLAGAHEGTTRVWIDDWSLVARGEGYRGVITTPDFRFALGFSPSAPILLQGEAGISRKGLRPAEASYYYSLPHLEVSGEIERGTGREQVTGIAWLDHEWSSAYLAPEAAGWDWIGINLADGSALMAFRMRERAGGVHYAGGTLRTKDGAARIFEPSQIAFRALRTWRSPRTGVQYPVAFEIRLAEQVFQIEPLMDDQELDARDGTGTIYWEGAVRALRGGVELGRGYLELTGYWKPMTL